MVPLEDVNPLIEALKAISRIDDEPLGEFTKLHKSIACAEEALSEFRAKHPKV